MIRRYTFLASFLLLLSVLTWWSRQIPSSARAAVVPQAIPGIAQRRELLESLDRLVAYEHYYRTVYGRFTRLTHRLGYSLPANLHHHYEVRVVEATRERLRVVATSETEAQLPDVVSVDQDYRIHANFPLPEPRADFLQAMASKHLRALHAVGPASEMPGEIGLFKGFFSYEVRPDALGRKTAFALGVKAPVVGVELEFRGAEIEMHDNRGGDLAGNGAETGQKPITNVMTTLEETYLAQRIFRGEVGRYARDWSELSKIAAFRFEDRESYGEAGQVPFGDAHSVKEIDVGDLQILASDEPEATERDSQEPMRNPSSHAEVKVEPLEIEPLSIEIENQKPALKNR